MTLTTIIEEQKKEFENKFKDSFSGGDMHSWERAEPIGDFLTTAITKGYELALEEAYEDGVKQTIAQFLRMNLENPKAPVNVDEVKRRALTQRV